MGEANSSPQTYKRRTADYFLAGGFFFYDLLEYLLGKFRQVNAPVAPDMATVSFTVFVFVALLIEISAKISIALVKEIRLTDGDPIELRTAVEKLLKLRLSLLVGHQLLIERSLRIDVPVKMQTCGEESVIIERFWIAHGYVERVAATHRQAANGAM